MTRKIGIPEPGARTFITLIVLALAIVGVMQFFWFRSSAIAELDAEHHSIVSTVTQTVSREYQRYAPLISSLRELAADGTASPAETETALSRLYGLYGPKGSVPGLVASVGIASPDTQTETTKLGTDGIWKRGKSEFSPPREWNSHGEARRGQPRVLRRPGRE